jgi:cysteinyl-tRNA synthetase
MATATTSSDNVEAEPIGQGTIRIYNTLTRTKEPFETVEPGRVGMYLCGPTVYREAHIGHMVGPVIFDTIKRYLTYSGYQVTWVVNITDVDDKLIAESNRRSISMFQIATEMTADYLANLKGFGVDQIDFLPRATDNMEAIIDFIQRLIDGGYAYVSQGDVFFDVTRDPEYGRLSNRSAASQQGEGGEAAGRKRSPGDFALWKGAKPGEPQWSSPWGAGRPGWHIECSAMSHRYLGQTFDIHGGGLDLVFPHHENELAQSRCCHSRPMARYWVHNGLMRADTQSGKVGGRSEREGGEADGAEPAAAADEAASAKISRSKGAGGLAELIQRHSGERLRFFLLRTHYRSTIVFGEQQLAEAGTALDTFYRLFERTEKLLGESFYQLDAPIRRAELEAPSASASLAAECLAHRQAFLAKMDDDFNTGGAISELFDLARAINRAIDSQGLEGAAGASESQRGELRFALTVLRELAGLLGLFRQPPRAAAGGAGPELKQTLEGVMQLLIRLRGEVRQRKDYATADAIRHGLQELGITLQDGPAGTDWRLEAGSSS